MSNTSIAPDVTRKRMFLETMERVLADTDKVIVDQKAGSGVVPYLPLSEFSKRRQRLPQRRASDEQNGPHPNPHSSSALPRSPPI